MSNPLPHGVFDTLLRWLRVHTDQRLYIRAHPVVFWLCIGLTIEGLLGVFFRNLFLASPVTLSLPDWMETGFYAIYMSGAAACVIGQLRKKAWLDSAGMSLLGTAFVVQFASIVYVLHQYFFQGLFLLTIAIGCFMRSSFLAEYGYPTRAVVEDGA